MKKIAFVFLAINLLTGCVTMYKPIGLMGGYSDIQLGENIFKVSFRGNGYTRAERAANFCLLRSAEIALENGFNYFVIVESGQSSTISAFTTPTTTTATGSTTTTTYHGQTYIISKPSSTNMILCYKEKPDIQGLVFAAEYVSKSIRQKYDIK
jgi:hypothetical protein